jgi:two-component sensor histidine kinase
VNNWIDFFYFFLLGAALLLSVLGVGFTVIMPGMERWSKRFFRDYFLVLMGCCLSGFDEMVLALFSAPMAVLWLMLLVESVLLALPLIMLTGFLLHCCGEDLRSSRLLKAVIVLGAVFLVLLVCSLFSDDFSTITPEMQYIRGPLYPLVTLPFTAIMLLNLTGAIRRRRQLSRKTFLSFLVAFVPMTLALVIHLSVDVFPLIYISTVLSSLSMYGLILSDQMEQELNHQREIANQRNSILVLQMRPHFIYNTLMTIYSLCNQDPQKARQVTADFTDYLRKNFNALASETPIPFSAELEHTRAYLAVEQAQHKQLLHVEYDTQFTFFRVPPLTLQPIAENAVKHGLDPYRGALHIMIRTCRTDKASVIVVEDNGPGFDAAQQSEAHTALTNIRQRLELMCDGKMEITAREEGGTRVTIRIPLRGTQGD